MPTRRTRRGRHAATDRITTEMIEAWRAGDAGALDRAIGRKPWEPSLVEVDRPEPPYGDGTMWAEEGWPRMWQIRQALIEAAGRPGAH